MFSPNNEDVVQVRHVVQGILVPCVFVIGLLGNSVSIYVLTRKRMRCTTNIYLTALAITDIIYLAMALLLSLKHYEYIQRYCEIYWMNYGIMLWLCDACAYISIYIAVCFTIERFIAIRYPLKRQTFCTESLAKKVIAAVALFCLFSTLSTAFEHTYTSGLKAIDNNGNPCNLTEAHEGASSKMGMPLTASMNSFEEEIQSNNIDDKNSLPYLGNEGSGEESIDYPGRILKRKRRGNQASSGNVGESLQDNIRRKAVHLSPDLAEASLLSGSKFAVNGEANDYVFEDLDYRPITPARISHPQFNADVFNQNESFVNLNITVYCQNVTIFKDSLSSLGKNQVYTRIWYFLSTFVFVLIPLGVLSTFNCFLIMLVRKSKSLRGEMTNASSIRRPKRKSHSSSVSQENRVTVTLIAVVLLFIICQLPWAIYLIVSDQMEIDENLQAIIGNIFNFLAAINAAANFFLYCVLSDKYRKTVRELITGYKYRQQRKNMGYGGASISSSLYMHGVTMSPGSTAYNNGSRRYRPAATSSSSASTAVVIK